MRIIILADTHGFLDPRVGEAAAGAELLVHAGDVGASVADQLAALGDELIIVAGNNDPEDAPWPSVATRELPGGQLAVMHGHQWPAKTRHRKLCERFAEAQAVVCGHSHRRVVESETVPWLLNPGAAGRSRAYGGPGYIELIATSTDWQVEAVAFEPRRRR